MDSSLLFRHHFPSLPFLAHSHASNETIQPPLLPCASLQQAPFFMPWSTDIPFLCKQTLWDRGLARGLPKKNVKIVLTMPSEWGIETLNLYCNNLWDSFKTILLQQFTFLILFLSPLCKTRNPWQFLWEKVIWEVVILWDACSRADRLSDSNQVAAQSY